MHWLTVKNIFNLGLFEMIIIGFLRIYALSSSVIYSNLFLVLWKLIFPTILVVIAQLRERLLILLFTYGTSSFQSIIIQYK